MVIFLAGLRQIPQMYYEAAAIDGAGPLRRFFSITLPLLTPIIFFNLVLQIDRRVPELHPGVRGQQRQAAARPTRPCSTRSTCTSRGFGNFDMGYASAMAWVLLLIIGGLHRGATSRPRGLGVLCDD